MLEEVYKNYRQLADEVNWKKYNQNDLFFEYIKHENDSLKDKFYAGIVCRYWGLSGRIYQQCNRHVPFEQCYDILIDAINYVLKKRVWENPESSLYEDPTGPDKAFHIALRRQRGILLSGYTAQKRQSNFNTLSIDEMYENYSDATEGLFNIVDESVAPTNEDEEILNYISSFNSVEEKIILDLICFTKWTSLQGISTKLRKLRINDFDYYNKTYQIERHDFIEFLCELSRMSNIRIMGLIQNLLVKVKENLYNV